VPFLNAKALEIDPDGMAFLRAVIRPDFEREKAATPSLREEPQPLKTVGQADPPKLPARSEAATAVPMG
jgi:hypothetical protein